MGDDDERSQSHVHEFTGSTFIAEEEESPHNHRFCGTTSEVVPCGDSHVHEILVSTDIFEDHLHDVPVRTSAAIPVGLNKHVHFAYGNTTVDDRHCHKFIFATQIEDPLEWEE